jgi:zinc protease
VTAGPESITLTGTCLAGKLHETITLAREMLLEPRWDEKEFPLLKSQTSENLKRMEAMPATIASNVFSKLLYGKDSILASVPMGSQRSIESVTMNDLKDYYGKHFSPTVAKVMMVGDVSREKALAVLGVFKDWPAKEVIVPEVKASAAAKPGIYFVDIPGARQSQFRVGHLSLPYSDPDYYRTVVMNHKLGGDFNGILNMILREEKGFTYGARSNFSAFSYPGFFVAATSVQTNATFETAQIIRAELAKYREGISADDLAMVKSTLLKGNALKFETLNALSQMLTPAVFYDLPFTYIKDNEAIVQKMTREEQRMLAQKYLQPEKMIYLIVGDRATQFDKLKELGLGEPILLDKEANPVTN